MWLWQTLCSISSLLIITKYGMLILNLFWDIIARLGFTKSILGENTGGQEVENSQGKVISEQFVKPNKFKSSLGKLVNQFEQRFGPWPHMWVFIVTFYLYYLRLTKGSNMPKVSLWVPSLVVSDLNLIARLEILKFQSKTNDTKRFSYFIWKIMSNLKPFSIYY